MGNQSASSPESRKTRITVIAIALFLLACLYLFRLFDMQIIQGLKYKELATLVSQRSVPILAKRGEIFDRHYDASLVLNTDSFQVNFNPAEVPAKLIPEILSQLASLLRLSIDNVNKKIPVSLYKTYRDIELQRGVEYSVIAQIAERIQDFPGVSWESSPVRNYTQFGSLAHVIGYVGNISQEELPVLFNQGYTANSILGKSGIEKRYDQILRGKEGTRYRTVDVVGRNVSITSQQEVSPEPGKDLVLTIDRHIQKLAEKALGQRMGSVVILKPSTGEILAMVSYPYFDANKFFMENTEKEVVRSLNDPTSPFMNRAIQGRYPPGSIFKMVLTTAIIEEKVFDPSRTINCTGTFELGGHIFKDNKITGHGIVNLTKALEQSCNVYYWTVGLKYLEIDRIADYAKKFGLGQPTEIDLPNEESGCVPTPYWKQKTMNYPWLGGDTLNVSIGQGNLLVTPLQMANVGAMIVNKGKIYRPYVIKSVHHSSDKSLLSETQPFLLHEVSIAPEVWTHIQNDMRKVITEGTPSVVITTKDVKIAGKTGTAEDGIKGSSEHSWFLAYAPWKSDVNVEDTVVVCIQVERTNEWEWWAPKAANLIFHGIFKKQTYEEVIQDLNPWYLRK